MTTRPPSGWWEWCIALQDLAPSDGAKVTGLAWASTCWNWRRGDEHRAAAPHLADFVEKHRGDVDERTVRRHFKELQTAGLMARVRAHSRWGPAVHEPRVPERYPAAANTGHVEPVLAPADAGDRANTGRGEPVLDANTGHSTSQHRTLVSGPLISPEVVQNPSSRARAHVHDAHVREAGAGVGDSDPTKTAGMALRQLVDETRQQLTSEQLRNLTSGWIRTAKKAAACLEHVEELLRGGWTLEQLRARVVEPPWGGVNFPGSTLEMRLRELRDVVPPAQPREQMRVKREQRDADLATGTSMPDNFRESIGATRAATKTAGVR